MLHRSYSRFLERNFWVSAARTQRGWVWERSEWAPGGLMEGFLDQVAFEPSDILRRMREAEGEEGE